MSSKKPPSKPIKSPPKPSRGGGSGAGSDKSLGNKTFDHIDKSANTTSTKPPPRKK